MNDGAATDGAVIDEIFALAKAAISCAEILRLKEAILKHRVGGW